MELKSFPWNEFSSVTRKFMEIAIYSGRNFLLNLNRDFQCECRVAKSMQLPSIFHPVFFSFVGVFMISVGKSFSLQKGILKIWQSSFSRISFLPLTSLSCTVLRDTRRVQHFSSSQSGKIPSVSSEKRFPFKAIRRSCRKCLCLGKLKLKCKKESCKRVPPCRAKRQSVFCFPLLSRSISITIPASACAPFLSLSLLFLGQYWQQLLSHA